ncbi:MAG: hypothetical protein K6U04_00135 [Armatimonadetes bacterium]|nr:hypothetical protein [Armatimonadota bacterium]
MAKNVINEKDLCRKYRTNVTRLIRAWKKGLNDLEIARVTGINPATLQQIREDIALAHRRLRLLQKKEALVKTGRHVFFKK